MQPTKKKVKVGKYTTIKNGKNKQKGGIKLGQGSFGCVISPAIKCKNTGNPPIDSVSKIIYKNPNAPEKYDRELKILKKIKEIDQKQMYLIGILDECELDINEILNRKMNDTKIVRFKNNERTQWDLLEKESEILSVDDIRQSYCLIDPLMQPRNQIQVNGGNQLDHLLEYHKSRPFSIIRYYYINVVKDILKGIKKMHMGRIAHRDIKQNNMVCNIINIKRKNKKDDNYPVVRHIDFGLAEMVDPDKFYELKDVRSVGTAGHVPPDILVINSRVTSMRDITHSSHKTYDLSQLNNAKKKAEVIDDLLRYCNKAYGFFYSFGITHEYGTGVTDTEKEYNFVNIEDLRKLYDMIKSELISGNFNDKYKKDIDGYVYKADIFAAGVALAYIKTKLGIKNPKFSDLIKNMVRINPNDRYNINQCLNHPMFN